VTPDRIVDARGMRCPWPVIRLGRPGSIRLLADDPAAPREVEALCAERGWLCRPTPDGFDIAIEART
jgi:tRNA 2-thiouridine synthesizing protein A